MKKFLVSLFFIIFISVIFSGTDTIRNYWSDDANLSFLATELRSIISSLAPYWDMIEPYRYYIIAFIVIDLLTILWIFRSKKRKVAIMNNPLTDGITVIDGSSILSKESLPQEEIPTTTGSSGVFISKEMLEKNKGK